MSDLTPDFTTSSEVHLLPTRKVFCLSDLQRAEAGITTPWLFVVLDDVKWQMGPLNLAFTFCKVKWWIRMQERRQSCLLKPSPRHNILACLSRSISYCKGRRVFSSVSVFFSSDCSISSTSAILGLPRLVPERAHRGL